MTATWRAAVDWGSMSTTDEGLGIGISQRELKSSEKGSGRRHERSGSVGVG